MRWDAEFAAEYDTVWPADSDFEQWVREQEEVAMIELIAELNRELRALSVA